MIYFLLLVALFAPCAWAQSSDSSTQLRTWKFASDGLLQTEEGSARSFRKGGRVEAQYVGSKGPIVLLLLQGSDRVYAAALTNFSEADRAYVEHRLRSTVSSRLRPGINSTAPATPKEWRRLNLLEFSPTSQGETYLVEEGGRRRKAIVVRIPGSIKAALLAEYRVADAERELSARKTELDDALRKQAVRAAPHAPWHNAHVENTVNAQTIKHLQARIVEQEKRVAELREGQRQSGVQGSVTAGLVGARGGLEIWSCR